VATRGTEDTIVSLRQSIDSKFDLALPMTLIIERLQFQALKKVSEVYGKYFVRNVPTSLKYFSRSGRGSYALIWYHAIYVIAKITSDTLIWRRDWADLTSLVGRGC
jgi:hypothetical protein